MARRFIVKASSSARARSRSTRNQLREEFLKMKEGDTTYHEGTEYMKIGSLLVSIEDDNDVLMLGIDF